MTAKELFDELEWAFDAQQLEGGNKDKIIEILADALHSEWKRGENDEARSIASCLARSR